MWLGGEVHLSGGAVSAFARAEGGGVHILSQPGSCAQARSEEK